MSSIPNPPGGSGITYQSSIPTNNPILISTTTPTATTKLGVSYLDFDTIKASLRDFLRSQQQFKDYDFEGSAMAVLLDLLAYNTHYNAFYMNMIANEMFMDSANLRSSVVSLAKMLNYTPQSIISATAQVSIVINPNNSNASAVIEKNTVFSSNVNGTQYNFVTAAAYGATISNGVFTFPTVNLIEGTPYIFRMIVNFTIPHQRFVLPNPNIDTSQLTVYVQQSATNTTLTSYTLASNLLQITNTSNVYWLQEVENMQFELKFGDGILGTALTDGNIIMVEYVLSDGPLANGATTFSPSIPLAGYPANNTTVTTLIPASGGLIAESTQEIKFIAPKNYQMQGRAVTAADYELAITQNYSNAASVTVWGGETAIPPQYGMVFISIKPVNGFVITETAKELLLKEIINPINVVSVIPTIVDPDYTYIIVNCTVKYNPALTFNTQGDIQNAAYTSIVNFSVINLDQFDLEFRYSKLLTAIDSSDPSITNNLTTIQLKKILTPVLGTPSDYTLNLYNPIVPGSLSSTSFITVLDPLLLLPYKTGNTYSFTDDGKGNIQMIQHALGLPDAVARNCGTIDYTTGTIVLNLVNPQTADVNGNITLTMNPTQNDILPSFNNILYILPSDVFVTVVANG